MIYLDNAATSHPKPASVYERVDAVLRNCSANPGRSGHAMAVEAARTIFRTRESIAALFNIADPDRIIFTANATGALNLAILGMLRPGDRCVTTTMEHNSVVRPLHALSQRGVTVVAVAAARDGSVDPQAVGDAIDARTRLVVVTHASNVVGTIVPIASIVSLAHDRGVPVLVDAAQTNRRDAVALAKLLRAGELTAVWVPDESHEAMRDLVRARAAAVETLCVHRQQVSAFMLRHGRIFPRKTTWGARHLRWLQEQRFDHPAHQIALQEMVEAVENLQGAHGAA